MASCSTSDETAILNFGFENNSFENWATIGNASIQDKDFGVSPLEGKYNALITTHAAAVTGASSEPVTPNDLSSFSQLTIDELNTINPNASLVTEGSAIKTTFNANIGDTVSISWNFLTEETAGGEGGMNDFAFFVLDSPGVLVEFTSSVFTDSNSIFPSETGYKEATLNIEADGEHTLTIGITNVFDTRFGSGLLIDNIRINRN